MWITSKWEVTCASYLRFSLRHERQAVVTAFAARSPFRCEVIPERERVRVAPAGELDLATAPKLERAVAELLDSGFDHIVLDLAGVRFLDSTGLHLVLSLQAGADAGTYRLQLKPGPPAVQRIFELTGTVDRLAFGPRFVRG